MNNKYQFSSEADVVVCGGGVSGCMAAMAAADEGKSVVLIDQFGQLGGSATAGLVTPLMAMFMEADVYKRQTCASALSSSGWNPPGGGWPSLPTAMWTTSRN